jgi:hypothetical protein
MPWEMPLGPFMYASPLSGRKEGRTMKEGRKGDEGRTMKAGRKVGR